MSDCIGVGIVGARFAAHFHWSGFQKVYGVPVRVTGVFSKSPESREAFAAEFGIRAFDSFEALCDACDVIDICAPGSVHETLAVGALRRGKHVIVEKPFTGYYGPGKESFRGNSFPKETMLREAMASCDRILQAAREANKLVCYAENWVYAPAIQKEREILVKSGGQIAVYDSTVAHLLDGEPRRTRRRSAAHHRHLRGAGASLSTTYSPIRDRTPRWLRLILWG